MNTPEQVLTCLKTHAARGMQKHPDFVSTADAVGVLNQFLGQARDAAAVPTDPLAQERFALALARIGGIVLKTYANLDIPLIGADHKPQDNAPDEPAPSA